MNKRLRQGYNLVKQYYGADIAEETLKEYELFNEDWRELAGSDNYSKFEPVALPLLKWSYLNTVNFEEILRRLHSVKKLRWKYGELWLLPKANELIDALMLAANAGGSKVKRKQAWIVVIWE